MSENGGPDVNRRDFLQTGAAATAAAALASPRPPRPRLAAGREEGGRPAPPHRSARPAST